MTNLPNPPPLDLPAAPDQPPQPLQPSQPRPTRTPRTPRTPENIAFPKNIKSFVRRTGRTTAGQARAFEDLGPEFLVPYRLDRLNLPALFGPISPEQTDQNAPQRPVVFEIGFGMGEASAAIAATLPGTDFLCCEVHDPGVGALLKRIGEQDLDNIRIIAHDAVEVIDTMLPVWNPSHPERGLDGVHIFFPDPWHKKRHNKRRLIQAPLIAKLAARLKPGGYLHCATDWQPYAEQILEVLSAEPLLRNASVSNELGGYAPKPHYRPLTKFENRGIKLGHGVWDIVFNRR